MAKALWPTILLVVVAVGIAALACEAELHSSLTDLEVGDCVEWTTGPRDVEELEHVDCSHVGAIRVVGVFDVTGDSGWPGEAAIQAQADLRCPWETSWVLGPTKNSWEGADDRRVACFEEVR
ncbi:unnamed protein product [marine sediment metagenome]|uniref:Septum formation-related domain-containing protein n=1 Tax=marine sediment metagenome TaxID=412755 RepID=X0XN09_9ZZZZ